MNKVEKEQWIVKMLIDEMFIIAGYPDVSYEDIIDRKDNWWMDWSMTVEQNEQWKKAGIDILRRERKWPKYRAVREMDWFSLLYGLKFSDYENKDNIG